MVIKCSMGYCIDFAVCVSNIVIFDADHEKMVFILQPQKSILLFINWNRFQALNQTSRGYHKLMLQSSKIRFSISKLPKKWKKNKKVYCYFILCHFWCILRLFRTFRGLYFVKGRPFCQNGVEIRDLHIQNT